jgi:hypothetical protein
MASQIDSARPSGHTAAVVPGLLVLYAAIVAWLTWPLAAQLGTHLPNTQMACDFDLPQTAFVLAHETHALTHAPSTFADAPIYHPTPEALYYADAAFGALPFFLPPFLLTGNPALAVNLALLVPAALTALALHLVVHTWTRSHLAGAIAAWTFLTTRWVLWEFAPTAPQYAAVFWFPFIIYMATRPPTRARDLTLSALIALQSLSSPVYLSAAVMIPIGTIALARLVRTESRGDGLRLLGAMGLAVVALVPVVAGYVAVRVATPNLPNQTYWRWYPQTTSLPWGPFAGQQAATAIPPVALAVAAAGLVAFLLPWRTWTAPFPRRAFGHAAFWAVAGTLLSLGPRATWHGKPIRIPHTLLAEWVPVYGTLRETARLGIGGLMGLALAAGLGFAACIARLPPRGRGATAVAAFLAVLVGGEMYREYAGGGPASRTALPAVYPTKRPPASASDPLVHALVAGDGPVLEVPVGLTKQGCIPGYHAHPMYRAIFHRRPLLNGYGGYWPSGFIARMQVVARLPDPAALAALRAETALTTVVVHVDQLYPQGRIAWQDALEHGAPGLRRIGSYDNAVVFDARAE